MKGIARAEGQGAGDYEAVLLAFSRLSHVILADQTPSVALAAAAQTAAVLLQTDSAAIFVYDPDQDNIEIAASYQMDFPTNGEVLAEPVVRQCIDTGVPVVIANAASERKKGLSVLAKLGLASILCVPIHSGDRRFGALTVFSKTLRAFSPSDIEVLCAIADQAALAAWGSKLPKIPQAEAGIGGMTGSEAELIDLANRKLQELSIINKVSEAIISTLNLSDLLKLALDQCLIAVGASVGSIMLLDEESGLLKIQAAVGLSQDVIDSASAAIGEGIAGWVARNGQPVLVHDARNDKRFQMQRYRDDITSAMAIPLKARGRVIGVLNASTVDLRRRYGRREVEFLSTVANQVAMSIDNARLYDRLQRRSAELASLLKVAETVTSTLELKEVIRLLAERFQAMPRVDACAILVYDADTGRFRCLDGRGLPDSSRLFREKDRKGGYLDLALPIAMKTLEIGGPMCVSLGADPALSSKAAEKHGFKTAACVTLTAASRSRNYRDKTIGAIVLISKTELGFSDSDLATFTALGGLAGVAVHNALVYKHKYDIARSLQSELTPTVPLTAEGLEIGHKFLPAREVGGDYYDLVQVTPGKVGIVIADVAGSSVSAAMYTSMGEHVLRAYALGNDSPSDVLGRLNRIVCDETNPEAFISLFYGIFDSQSRIFRYGCAGHEPPLLCRPDGSFERLTADGILIGVSMGIKYEEKEIILDPGSILVLFTDGVVESQAVKGKFGIEEMSQIVSAHMLKPAQEVADNIYTKLVELTGSRTRDDAAFVVLKAL